MKTILLNFISCLLFVSCQNKSATESVSEASASKDSISNTFNDQPGKSIPLDSLKNFYGKKLKSDSLFEQFAILPRLEKLMGNGFTDFKDGWGEESALMHDGEVMYATACKSNDCKAIKVLLVIDGLSNNLNVYVFNNQKIKTYEESNIIGLTETIGAQYEKLRDEQKRK